MELERQDGTSEAEDDLVLVHVDTVEGVRLVTYHEFPRQEGAERDAHRLVRRGGTIAGVYEGQVEDGLYRLVDDGLELYHGPAPGRS